MPEPKTIEWHCEFSVAGQGYNKEVMPKITPIKLYDLTLKEHRDALRRVFDGKDNALVTIIGAENHVIIPFRHQGIVYMKRSSLMYNKDGTRASAVDPYESITSEEFFNALPPEQANELIFFLDLLTKSAEL